MPEACTGWSQSSVEGLPPPACQALSSSEGWSYEHRAEPEVVPGPCTHRGRADSKSGDPVAPWTDMALRQEDSARLSVSPAPLGEAGRPSWGQLWSAVGSLPGPLPRAPLRLSERRATGWQIGPTCWLRGCVLIGTFVVGA